jgi:hypothetical protein
MGDIKKIYSKEFLNAVDDALLRCANDNSPTTLIYKRKDKLDVRVKFDAVPPAPATTTLVYEGT